MVFFFSICHIAFIVPINGYYSRHCSQRVTDTSRTRCPLFLVTSYIVPRVLVEKLERKMFWQRSILNNISYYFQMKLMMAKHEEHKERLERQLREDRESQRQQLENFIAANMGEQRRCREAMNVDNETLMATIAGLAHCAMQLQQLPQSDSDDSDSDDSDSDYYVLSDSDSDDECVIQ